GTQVMGFAVLAIQQGKPHLVEMGAVKLTKEKDIYARLETIHRTITGLVKTHQPHLFAIEAPFFGKNIQSMLKLGRAQGVSIAAAMQTGIPVTEYAPKKIKQSITGNGNADKDQVWKMLQHLLGLDTKPAGYDSSDALAIAYCHYLQQNKTLVAAVSNASPGKPNTKKKKNSWEDFLSAHPERLKKP
ncbi:MAG: crossover junction endodeoxyribonuclease RuvC, partial [Sphingobacteriia bacterium]